MGRVSGVTVLMGGFKSLVSHVVSKCWCWKCFDVLFDVLVDWCLTFFERFQELQSEKTRVRFGRTDLSFGANGTFVRALLYKHGPTVPRAKGIREE